MPILWTYGISFLSVTPLTETPVQFAISVKLTGIARRNFLRNFIINFLENLKRCCFLSKLISSLKYCDQTFSREIDIKLKALWWNVSWKIKSSLRAAQNVSKVYGMFLAVFLSLRVIKFVYCLKFNSIIWDLPQTSRRIWRKTFWISILCQIWLLSIFCPNPDFIV